MPFNSKFSTVFLTKRRRRRCRKCEGCQCPPCGKCVPCTSKNAFGSKTPVKRSCVERVCTVLNGQQPLKPPNNFTVSSRPQIKKERDEDSPGKNNSHNCTALRKSGMKDASRGSGGVLKPSTVKSVVIKTKEPNIGSKPPASAERTEAAGPSSPSHLKEAYKGSCSPLKVKHAGRTFNSLSDVPMEGKTSPMKPQEDFPYVNTQKMTKNELSIFMMKLLKKLALNGAITLRQKPDWWPSHVEWGVTHTLQLEEMIDVIRQCYKAYGKENMVIPSCLNVYKLPVDTMSLKPATACRKVSINFSSEVLPPSPVKRRGCPQELYLPFTVEIFICYFCEKEFVSKDKMRIHQKHCTERPPHLTSCNHVSITSDPASATNPPQISPRSQKLRVDVDREFVPLKQFAGYLGLVPSQTALKIKAERKCSEISSEILEDIEQPLSPITCTPRTPKSLISQLSREEPGGFAKKRLSYNSLCLDKVEEKEVFMKEQEISDSEAEMEADKPKSTNLLNIPISSLLGQKIQKYVHTNLVTPVLNNTESFCKTPTKNNFLEKLRKKPPSYPITYKPRRIAHLEKCNHLYKFNKLQVREFLGKLKYGIDLESQKRMKNLNKFRIGLARLSENEILKWMPRQRMERQLYMRFQKIRPERHVSCPDDFPAGPTLLSKNIDKLLGLKKRSSVDNQLLSLGNYVSEEMEAEVSKLQLALYKSLLYEMSILKPTVLVSDLQCVSEEHDKVIPCLDVGFKGDFDKRKGTGVDQRSESASPDSSAKRTFLLKEKRKENEEGISQRKKMNASSPKLKRIVHKKEKSEKAFTTVAPYCMIEKPGRGAKSKMAVPSNISPIKKVSATSRVSPRSMCSPGIKSQCDDCFSVISLSSDSESFSSDCCINCRSNEARMSLKSVVSDGAPCRDSANIEPKSLNCKHLGDLEPLSLNVNYEDKDLLLQKVLSTNNSYGVTSDSAITESLSVCTPPVTPIKSSVQDVGMSPNTEKRQRRSARQSAMSENNSLQTPIQPECLNTREEIPTPKGKDVVPQHVVSVRRFQHSQSLTPTSSSKKNSLQTSASLPCTPKRAGSRETVRKRSPQLVESGRVLRGSPSSTRSLQHTPVKANNPYALNSGNFIISSSSTELSPKKLVQATRLFKSNSVVSEISKDSPVTRGLKRLRSSNSENERSPVKSKKLKRE